MQGLSAFRVAHCCPSFSGCSRRASPAPRQHLLLFGFQQRSSFFECGRGAFAPPSRRLKISTQDEAATEHGLPLAEEEDSTKLVEEDVSTNNVAGEEGPKVNVKFILEKKCHYGQRFNVVGNDPLFGNWEVEAAIPMKWAEGDIWSVEVPDVPAEKQFEFKFVLTGEKEEIVWQPGSNRVLNTVEGISPLVVNEAWKSVDDDEAEEEGVKTSDLVEDTTSSETGGLLVPANVTEDATIDQVVKAFESNNGADVPKSEPETVPEIPLAESDVVATAVKTALGVDDLLTEV